MSSGGAPRAGPARHHLGPALPVSALAAGHTLALAATLHPAKYTHNTTLSQIIEVKLIF